MVTSAHTNIKNKKLTPQAIFSQTNSLDPVIFPSHSDMPVSSKISDFCKFFDLRHYCMSVILFLRVKE